MYDDIIDVEYPFDLGHPRMSLYDRSSQFMPFSALVGYKEAVLETARITSDRIILDEEMKEILDNKLNIIRENINLKPNVNVTYFVPDKVKTGGSYVNVLGGVKKIDLYKSVVYIGDKKISIDNIIDIFPNFFSVINFWFWKMKHITDSSKKRFVNIFNVISS